MPDNDSRTTSSTSTKSMPKTGVLLVNMGGPDSPESIEHFLYNLFSDPDIIKLPMSFLFQKPLAWMIVNSRLKEAQANYAKMEGWGGGSPQLPITQEQAAALKTVLNGSNQDIPVYIAMRYWHPFTDAALAEVSRDGIEHLVVVTLYPHFSYTTTGSSLNELRRGLMRNGLSHVGLSIVSGYCKDPEYLSALAACIETGLDEHEWTCDRNDVQILFSAHSLPVKHVERTGDPYPKLIESCIEAVMKTHFPDHEWDLAYQSKVGNMPWLGPPTDGVIAYYAGHKRDNILVVPISFVSDHIETLVEIDIDYIDEARDMGIQQIFRAPVMNTRVDFIQLLARLVREKMTAYACRGLQDVPSPAAHVAVTG